MNRKALAILLAVMIAAIIPILPIQTNQNTVYAESTSIEIYTVSVQTGYLALRSAKAYDYRNEIGELYTGDKVHVLNKDDPTYWYVYSPKHNRSGYVNKNYLVRGSQSIGGDSYTVSVQTGYLALRTAKAYDYRNEIGELYTGDTVQVLNKDDPTYWYVYSPKYDRSGYVNKNYLISNGYQASYPVYTVRVNSGYLALRTAKAYDYNNEIGALYTGDIVEVWDMSDPTYWYVYSPKLNLSGYVNRNYLY